MKKHIIRISLLCILLMSLHCTLAAAQIDVQSTMLSEDQFLARICITSDNQPVYIILDQLTIGGVPFDLSGGDLSDMWSGYPTSSESHSMTGEFFVELEEGYIHPSVEDRAAAFSALSRRLAQDAETEVSFRITLLTPKQSIQAVDISFDGDSSDEWKQVDAIVSNGNTPVDSEQPYTAMASSNCLDSIRTDEPVSFPLGNVEILLKHANMCIVEQEVFHFAMK